MHASKYGDRGVVEMLIHAGANINADSKAIPRFLLLIDVSRMVLLP